MLICPPLRMKVMATTVDVRAYEVLFILMIDRPNRHRLIWLCTCYLHARRLYRMNHKGQITNRRGMARAAAPDTKTEKLNV